MGSVRYPQFVSFDKHKAKIALRNVGSNVYYCDNGFWCLYAYKINNKIYVMSCFNKMLVGKRLYSCSKKVWADNVSDEYLPSENEIKNNLYGLTKINTID